MMAAKIRIPRLIDRLPAVAGTYEEMVPLSRLTWFRTGGAAEVLFEPKDAEDLARFLAEREDDILLTVVGVGSNLLVRDGGVPGVVIRLGRAFADIDAEGTEIKAGAAAMDVHVAARARDAVIAGMEFLKGVPGTVGGAIRMNAGAYEAEIKDVVASVEALDAAGRAHVLGVEELGFGYRSCAVPEDWIFIAARLRGRLGKRADIARRMKAIHEARADSQPLGVRTGGSTFTNPPGQKAWELIERAGCRGLRRGGAEVSEKHCNFLVNTGKASAADLEGLGEEVRRRVFADTGVKLEWEIQRIGIPAAAGLEEADQ